MKLIAVPVLFLLLSTLGCTAAEPNPVPTLAPSTRVPAETPTLAPPPDIEATIAAGIQATLAAQPTSTPLPTLTPEPTPIPTQAPTPTPYSTTTPLSPTPTPIPRPTAAPSVRVDPTATPRPSAVPSGRTRLNLDPTSENYPLILLHESNPSLASTLLELPWVQDGITAEESTVLSYFRALESENPSVAEDIARMPFIAESGERGDENTIYALLDLSRSYPKELELLLDEKWYQDGLTQNEAYYVTVLHRHAVLSTLEIFGRDDYQVLLDKGLGSLAVTRRVQLPRAGEVELVAFNRPLGSRDADHILDHIEAAVKEIETFVGISFPNRQILLLFTDPGAENVIGRYLGTHMIASPQLGVKDLNRTLTHEIAHYYWSNDNLPFWMDEGGSDFLSTYVSDLFEVESIESRRSEMLSNFGGVTYCKNKLGIDSIQELLDRLERTGLAEHQEASYFFCNYSYGEIIAIDLYQVMGDTGFRAAWKEIYRLSQETDGDMSEALIYQTFLDAVPEQQVGEFKEIYRRWHGGEFQ